MGPRPSGPVVLGPLFGRLRDTPAGERAHCQAARNEDRRLENRNRLVDETCQAVLAALGSEEPQ